MFFRLTLVLKGLISIPPLLVYFAKTVNSSGLQFSNISTNISDVKETSARSINSAKLGSHGSGEVKDNLPNKHLNPPFSFVTDDVKGKMESL